MSEIHLIEPTIPGILLGKIVIDKAGKICGICWAVKIKSGKCFIEVRGEEIFEIPMEEIEINENIHVKKEIKCKEVNSEKISRLLDELVNEILLNYEFLKMWKMTKSI